MRRTVWEKDNPGQVPADADIEWRQSRRPELKGQELEYVKVYKDRDEDRLDFSEEEADEVVTKKTVDDGTCILEADQVRCVIDLRYACIVAINVLIVLFCSIPFSEYELIQHLRWRTPQQMQQDLC